jgi:DNA-binding IclR family transcriptional regulator
MTSADDRAQGDDSAAPRPTIAVVEKAMALVECFTRAQGEMGVRELAKVSGLPATTVHRLLATMENGGWVVRRGSGYVLSLRLAEIASHILAGIDLREEARPVMQRLSRETGETTYLVMRQADHAVCVERIEGDRMVRVMAWDVGSTLPLYAGGAPLALLAFQSQRDIDRILELHPLVLPTGQRADVEQLRRRLEDIRSHGWSVSENETIPGIISIGVPVFGPGGRPAAALSVGGLATGFTPDRRQRIVELLIESGHQLTRQTGGVPPQPSAVS